MAADGRFAKNILHNDEFTWGKKQKYKSELVNCMLHKQTCILKSNLLK